MRLRMVKGKNNPKKRQTKPRGTGLESGTNSHFKYIHIYITYT